MGTDAYLILTQTKTRMEKARNKRTREEQSLNETVGLEAVFRERSFLSNHVFVFLDIPSLGRCAQVSKDFQAAVAEDVVWKHHLKLLLRKVFDNAFFIEPKERGRVPEPVPLSDRELKSTNFRAWYMEWHAPPRLYCMMFSTAVKGFHTDDDGNTIRIEDMTGRETFYSWLEDDVPLRNYYKEAGHFAWLGKLRDIEEIEENEDYYGDSDYDDDRFDYDGVYLGVTPNMFRGLPNLRLFHGHY